jgi:hypothetical protein
MVLLAWIILLLLAAEAVVVEVVTVLQLAVAELVGLEQAQLFL